MKLLMKIHQNLQFREILCSENELEFLDILNMRDIHS